MGIIVVLHGLTRWVLTCAKGGSAAGNGDGELGVAPKGEGERDVKVWKGSSAAAGEGAPGAVAGVWGRFATCAVESTLESDEVVLGKDMLRSVWGFGRISTQPWCIYVIFEQ